MRRPRRIGIAIAALLAIGALVAVGSVGAKQNAPRVSQVTSESVAPSALKLPEGALALSEAMSRVFLDPVTGEIREPNAEELAEIGRAARRVASASTAEPEVFSLPGGGIGAAVPSELWSFSTVRLLPDDGVELSCAQGSEDAVSLVARPVPAASTEEER